MLQLKITSKYKKDFKHVLNNKELIEEIVFILEMLQKGETLPEKYKAHQLKGKLFLFRECHIRPDILLIYKKNDISRIIILSRLGIHSQLGFS